jgi:hypothetical protein
MNAACATQCQCQLQYIYEYVYASKGLLVTPDPGILKHLTRSRNSKLHLALQLPSITSYALTVDPSY